MNIFWSAFRRHRPMQKSFEQPPEWQVHLKVLLPLYLWKHLIFRLCQKKDVKRLRSNMRLAEQLGAKIETVYGEDVSFQIAEFARLSGVSKIVIGRSARTRKKHIQQTHTYRKVDCKCTEFGCAYYTGHKG